MKRSKFGEGPIACILRQAEAGTAVGEVCHKAGISEATFYAWRKKYAGLIPSEMKQLEEENGKLKKIVADLSLAQQCCMLCPAACVIAFSIPRTIWRRRIASLVLPLGDLFRLSEPPLLASLASDHARVGISLNEVASEEPV